VIESPGVRVTGEAAEVARAEAQAVLAMVHDEERRLRLADVVAALDDGRVAGDDADALAELLELGLQTGRVRAVYGPGGEQAALALFRRLPRGRDLTESTRDLNAALAGLAGRTLEKLTVHAVGSRSPPTASTSSSGSATTAPASRRWRCDGARRLLHGVPGPARAAVRGRRGRRGRAREDARAARLRRGRHRRRARGRAAAP
jgi:hypothetical protein